MYIVIHACSCTFSPFFCNVSAGDADYTTDLMWAYISEKISAMENGIQLRGPYLARLEFLRRLLARKLDLANTVGM